LGWIAPADASAIMLHPDDRPESVRERLGASPR
jgi:hypothetical protein